MGKFTDRVELNWK